MSLCQAAFLNKAMGIFDKGKRVNISSIVGHFI